MALIIHISLIIIHFIDFFSFLSVISITVFFNVAFVSLITLYFRVSLSQIIRLPITLSTKKTQHVVCTSYTGRLGNLMFEFASSYGIARSNGMKLVVPTDLKLLKIFELNGTEIIQNSSACDTGHFVRIGERKCCAFDQKVVNLNATNNVKLVGYLQSYYYFNKYISEVRKLFTFRSEIRNKSNDLLKSIYAKNNITSSNNVTLVGVHVRRGDYVHNKNGKIMATKEYLQTAVRWFKSRHTNLHFIVASNGMKWTKLNMPRNMSVSYLEGNSAEVDMATITSCHHMISSVGTFSWWSGWLIKGNVTYYKWPSKEGTKFRRQFSNNYSDFFYPNWIGL